MNLSGNPLDFLWVFFGGVLVSFTPCLYPVLPITIAYIGASSANSRIKGFSLSLIYVTGISITYVCLGLVAVLTSTIFGQFSNQPLVRIIAGLIIILFGISLWLGKGLVRMPRLKLPVIKRPASYLSCFMLGLASGLVITPCTAPVLGSILTFVATKRNFIYGVFLLFSFAYGMGLLIILTGTFSSILTALPKSGRWTEIIKKICAAILIASGIYFVASSIGNVAYAQDTQIENTCFDFSLNDLDGNETKLSEFRYKKSVVLFFWTTWCPYCIRKLRELNQIYPELVAEDIEVLAINVQEGESKVRKFLRSNPVVFKVLLDFDGRVSYCYKVIGVPMFVFVTKEGEIIPQWQMMP